ncbi:hypothetical protein Sjap_009409 [Stephania japonica]|uniref:SREBP regulating gene protein n=1 Tax=Stephania japonica TaxID=461633 RepID=A0AAP0JSA4_9MAGN
MHNIALHELYLFIRHKFDTCLSVLPGAYMSVFYYCAGRCRHNSESVVHENAYIIDFHHCFSLPSNSSGE